MRSRRRICFVTGTRAEFGLMTPALRAIRADSRLELQLVATGMHLDAGHGRTIDEIRGQGWKIDAVVPWKAARGKAELQAAAMGRAISLLPGCFQKLESDVVLVVGDRVEAFAGAAAAHVAGKIVAHVHGGDRAMGQVDDSLRHAISKLAHIHFPATSQSAERLARMGEPRWRVFRAGSPGVDGIRDVAATAGEIPRAFPVLKNGRFALVVLHPTDACDDVEYARARMLLDAVCDVSFDHVVIVYPNNDPGSAGIVRCWREVDNNPRLIICRDIARPLFLGLMRDAAVLAGNSSSGIIEAASFGTPVIDVGVRQAGRERSANVTNVPFERAAMIGALKGAWNMGRPRRYRGGNVYGGGGAGRRIASVLGRIALDDRLRRKLISY